MTDQRREQLGDESVLRQFRRASDQILAYLAAEYDDQGVSRTGPDNIQFYYKLPAVLAVGGYRSLALKVLRQAVSRFLRDEQFLVDDDPFAAPWKAYLAGWLSWGAGSLGRFDVARRLMASTYPLQQGPQKGFVHQTPQGPVQDTQRSSAAGMGCVWALDLERAASVGMFLGYALEHQPAPDRQFMAYFDMTGQATGDPADRNVCFQLADAQARPALFGTTVAALVWLGRALGQPWPMELARRYLRLVLKNQHDPAAMPLCTKLGWAALLVNETEAEPDFSEFALRAGLQLLARQDPDGGINFDDVPEVPKPLDKVWRVGWTCDAALTLMALADGAA